VLIFIGMEASMNKFINKLERKYGRYAIHNLMRYILGLYVIGFVIERTNPLIYYNYLSFDIKKILSGQVWRLFTFLVQSPEHTGSVLFLLISLYFYYMIGNSLENAWGAFRFNLYFLSGILFNVLGAIVVYIITRVGFNYGVSIPVTLEYINQSMLLAFAVTYPEVQILLMYIIPIKMKYLGMIYGAVIAYEVFQYLVALKYLNVLVILFALANFIIFFLSTRNYKRISPSEIRRKKNYRRQTRQSTYGNVTQFKGKNVVTRHKCAVCGRTELDDDNLEFRFCSKCNGNFEYCSDCLYTHEHVK